MNKIALGDLVLVPYRHHGPIGSGGWPAPAESREDLPELVAVRPVEWAAKEVAAQVPAEDLRHALGR
jgi:predicted Mrr-cat superfamily restriction endonuclease